MTTNAWIRPQLDPKENLRNQERQLQWHRNLPPGCSLKLLSPALHMEERSRNLAAQLRGKG